MLLIGIGSFVDHKRVTGISSKRINGELKVRVNFADGGSWPQARVERWVRDQEERKKNGN